MIKLEPYLNFEGNCMEAFEYYRSIFGEEFTPVTRYKDAPGMEFGENDRERVMHIGLRIGDVMLMGGDTPSSMILVKGQDVRLSLAVDDEGEARRIFDRLSEGGSGIIPLSATFWAELFGMVTDKFGINWIVMHGWK